MAAPIAGLQTRSYEDKDSRKVYVTEVVAESVILLGGNGGSSERREDEAPVSRPRGQSRQQPVQDAFDQGIGDDDVPF